MSEPTVIDVRDGDGRIHTFAVGSKMLRDGLADGTYRLVEEAKPDEAEVPAHADDLDAGPVDRGSGDGERSAGPADSGDRARADKPKPRR